MFRVICKKLLMMDLSSATFRIAQHAKPCASWLTQKYLSMKNKIKLRNFKENIPQNCLSKCNYIDTFSSSLEVLIHSGLNRKLITCGQKKSRFRFDLLNIVRLRGQPPFCDNFRFNRKWLIRSEIGHHSLNLKPKKHMSWNFQASSSIKKISSKLCWP